MVIVEGLVLGHPEGLLDGVSREGRMREIANLLRFHCPVAGGLFGLEGPKGSATSVPVT